MDINVVDFLHKNGLEDIEELKVDDNYMVIKFIYDFDNDELSAAKAYCKDEADAEEESEEWYEEWYMPYLSDIAQDNIQEILEDICEEYDIESEFRIIESNNSSYEYIEVIAVFCNENFEMALEEIINDYI